MFLPDLSPIAEHKIIRPTGTRAQVDADGAALQVIASGMGHLESGS
jgi:hypothetical protein